MNTAQGKVLNEMTIINQDLLTIFQALLERVDIPLKDKNKDHTTINMVQIITLPLLTNTYPFKELKEMMAWNLLQKIKEVQELNLTKVTNKDKILDMIKEVHHKNHPDSGQSNKCPNSKVQILL